MRDQKSVIDYLVRYNEDIACGDDEPATVFDRYHAPGFVLVNNGTVFERDALLAHARPTRRNVTSIRIDVHQALADHDEVAARYTMTASMRQGTTAVVDVHLFGCLVADGRLQRIDQITRDIG